MEAIPKQALWVSRYLAKGNNKYTRITPRTNVYVCDLYFIMSIYFPTRISVTISFFFFQAIDKDPTKDAIQNSLRSSRYSGNIGESRDSNNDVKLDIASSKKISEDRSNTPKAQLNKSDKEKYEPLKNNKSIKESLVDQKIASGDGDKEIVYRRMRPHNINRLEEPKTRNIVVNVEKPFEPKKELEVSAINAETEVNKARPQSNRFSKSIENTNDVKTSFGLNIKTNRPDSTRFSKSIDTSDVKENTSKKSQSNRFSKSIEVTTNVNTDKEQTTVDARTRPQINRFSKLIEANADGKTSSSGNDKLENNTSIDGRKHKNYRFSNSFEVSMSDKKVDMYSSNNTRKLQGNRFSKDTAGESLSKVNGEKEDTNLKGRPRSDRFSQSIEPETCPKPVRESKVSNKVEKTVANRFSKSLDTKLDSNFQTRSTIDNDSVKNRISTNSVQKMNRLSKSLESKGSNEEVFSLKNNRNSSYGNNTDVSKKDSSAKKPENVVPEKTKKVDTIVREKTSEELDDKIAELPQKKNKESTYERKNRPSSVHNFKSQFETKSQNTSTQKARPMSVGNFREKFEVNKFSKVEIQPKRNDTKQEVQEKKSELVKKVETVNSKDSKQLHTKTKIERKVEVQNGSKTETAIKIEKEVSPASNFQKGTKSMIKKTEDNSGRIVTEESKTVEVKKTSGSRTQISNTEVKQSEENLRTNLRSKECLIYAFFNLCILFNSCSQQGFESKFCKIFLTA